MPAMTVLSSANGDVRSNSEHSGQQSAWYTGMDLEWRPSTPAGNGVSESSKRSGDETASPANQQFDQQQFNDMPFDAELMLLDDVDMSHTLGSSGVPTNGHTPLSGHIEEIPRTKMQTGCIPCLIKGIKCDPSNPECKAAMSDDWAMNAGTRGDDDDDDMTYYSTPSSTSLTLFRPDQNWRRSWRERHCLNFFVNFSAPQMAGFFDSAFWQRMVIQTSYHEPAIRHAITAIGALHECIMQRTFADEAQKSKAMDFALNQCNKAIACLTSDGSDAFGDAENGRRRTPSSRLALTTCVLFTCFEAMQGRCDSAVNHALQGRRLLQATGRPNGTTMNPAEEDDIEQMRPLVERLEVQATALLDKGRRPDVGTSGQTPPLPPVDHIFSLEHAHNTLHTALNSVMRFMQGFHPTAPRDHIAVTMAEKHLRYAPWFMQWEAAFATFLADNRDYMTNMETKRAMVLKANHLVGTMLASVDQSAGPVAYDTYESEFRAIVDLAREVLQSFSYRRVSGTPGLSYQILANMRAGQRQGPAPRPKAPRPQPSVEEQTAQKPDAISTNREENEAPDEYPKFRAMIEDWREEDTTQAAWLKRGGIPVKTERMSGYCTAACHMPRLPTIRRERANPGMLRL